VRTNLAVALAIGLALGLSACAVKTTEPPAATVPVAPAKPEIFGVLGGSLGQKLGEADRQIAFEAQIEALNSGQRKSWRGSNGSFGYVETAASGGCKSYSHTIYLSGRPQTASATACKQSDGGWKASN
jgi:surface antigen